MSVTCEFPSTDESPHIERNESTSEESDLTGESDNPSEIANVNRSDNPGHTCPVRNPARLDNSWS